MIPIFDSNIIIDFMNARPEAASEICRFPQRAVSIITWIEVQVGAKDVNERTAVLRALSYFELVHVTNEIAQCAITLRQTHRIALPDAIIWATAKSRSTILVTRNEKDFDASEPDIRIPYRL